MGKSQGWKSKHCEDMALKLSQNDLECREEKEMEKKHAIKVRITPKDRGSSCV